MAVDDEAGAQAVRAVPAALTPSAASPRSEGQYCPGKVRCWTCDISRLLPARFAARFVHVFEGSGKAIVDDADFDGDGLVSRLGSGDQQLAFGLVRSGWVTWHFFPELGRPLPARKWTVDI